MESTEVEHKSADSENENGAYNEKVLFLSKVNGLDHFKTGNSDEAVKRNADSAENAARNCIYERNKGAEKRKKN